jgi:glycerol-3-phosphate dehydrogenase (NAD(P)+)
MRRLAILGGGAWGTALALLACRAGGHPVLWARDPEIVASINERHANPVFLPGIPLDPAIIARSDLAASVEGAEALVVAVPSQFVRGLFDRLAPAIPAALPLLLCSKGIEIASRKTISELAREILPGSPVAVLSGPSFALEVARDLPAAVTIASRDGPLARHFIAALGNPRFRPYSSSDPIGAEIGGAVKNVIAIACGIVVGRGLGDNARAAVITRGLAEMIRLGLAKGARAETFSGLSGLGDLVLTCSRGQSRNHALGLALGGGESLESWLHGRRSVVEGVATASAVVALSARLGVEMPIVQAVDRVLHRGAAIDAMTAELLHRPFRSE